MKEYTADEFCDNRFVEQSLWLATALDLIKFVTGIVITMLCCLSPTQMFGGCQLQLP